jgi:hypothetical protein
VRLIAISALGGLGKTALLGAWLRKGAHRREGVFLWSFYGDQSTARMLKALEEFKQPGGSLAIALDGLEAIQDSPGTSGYGKLLDPTLSKALNEYCRARDGNLVLLTSRFPFPDLTPYLGRGMRYLPLASLKADEGATLLEALGVGGNTEDRAQVSRQLEGHALALRIFALAMPPGCRGDPTRLWSLIFGTGEHPLEEKVRHLLEFYEKRLPAVQRQALGLLALFRVPVRVETLQPLWGKLMDAPAPLRETLDYLHREHLLTDDPDPEGERRYSCHPILRDHFRRSMMDTEGFAINAASVLGGDVSAAIAATYRMEQEAHLLASGGLLHLDFYQSQNRAVETIMPIITAIEILLGCGDVRAANDLYRWRLEKGFIFQTIPAPNWGMEVTGWFVRDEVRRQRLETELGASRLSYYAGFAGGFAQLAGEPRDGPRALRHRRNY